jgi:acyl dehydratase
MDPTEFEGRSYGPRSWRVAADAVADYVHVTGDDPERWSENAPPGFASAALFAVAPDLLAELYDHSVIHGEQTFEWSRSLAVGSLLEVRGEVTRVRQRGGVNFITFEMEAQDGPETVLGGRSLFLVSGEAIPGNGSGFERPEPHHSFAGDPAPGRVSASRADLIRYASATRDWNPVHWDHEAGVAAGFPGVVVHGLLQAGWALRFAAHDSIHPFTSARFRFRNPLLPARPVDHSVERQDGSIEVSILDEENVYLTATITIFDE